MSEASATWVYAVVEATGARSVAATGIAGGPVRLVEEVGLVAVVDSVTLDEVETEPPGQLRDPAWLERHARIHHRVVTTCFQALPTVPFRLATLYRDDSRVRELLADRLDQFLDALEVVTGRAEWGVRAYASPPAPVPADHPPTAAGAGPGTAYLFRQRAARAAQEQARWEAWEAARLVDGALAQIAVATRRQPLPPAGADPAGPGTPVLNTSYLVDERGRDRFLATAGRLAERHPAIRLRTTGPWPAYSFVEPGSVDAEAEGT